MAFFHKEKYKLRLRQNILTKISPTQKDPKERLKEFKQIFAKTLPGESFFPELVQDLLNEESTPEGNEQKESNLKRLEEKLNKAKKEDKGDSLRTILLQSIRYLASCGYQLEDTVVKLTENNQVVATKRRGAWARFRRWLRKVFKGGQDMQTLLEIEYFDVVTSSTKTEKINFITFIDELQRKAKLYTSLTSKGSVAFKRLKSAPEEKVFEFLRKNIVDLQLQHRRIMGLSDYFRSEAAAEDKARIRGVKIELSALKNSIMKANQKRHEYVAVKEEQEQMRRLGLKMNTGSSPISGGSSTGDAVH